MKRPVDFAAALAEARRVLETPQPVPDTWLIGIFHLEDKRDALGRPLTGDEAREFAELAGGLWRAAADGIAVELEAAVGARDGNAIRRVLGPGLVALRDGAVSAGADWDRFTRDHQALIAQGRALITPKGSGSR
jgi:hypothetical protein